MLSLKHIVVISFILAIMPVFSGCMMMPFRMAPLLKQNKDIPVDPQVGEAVDELALESVNDLIENHGSYQRILLGETQVYGDLVPKSEFRSGLIERLRNQNVFEILNRDDSTAGSSENPELHKSSIRTETALLNVQLYQTDHQLWLTQQLIDMRTNQIFWSGIYANPMPESVPKP